MRFSKDRLVQAPWEAAEGRGPYEAGEVIPMPDLSGERP